MKSLLLLSVALASGCAPAEEPISRELYELERLAFVPAAPCYLQPNPLAFTSKWDFSIKEAIVMDLYELTNRDLAYYSRHSGPDAGLPEVTPPTDSAEIDRPAPLSFEAAARLAELRGMRLPTYKEWIHVAIGRRGLYYPWGQDQSSVANTLETGLGTPTDVGTFESGRGSPFGCYDLVGNVWEWVDGIVPGYDDVLDERGVVVAQGEIRSALGGAYDSPRRATYEWDRIWQGYTFNAIQLDPTRTVPNVGARMCADAAAYLRDKAPRWGTDATAREHVVAVATGWAQDPVARQGLGELLDELSKGPDAPDQLAWLREGLERAESQVAEAE